MLEVSAGQLCTIRFTLIRLVLSVLPLNQYKWKLMSHLQKDKADDAPAGIRSTALLFGEHTRPILSGFSATSMSLISYAGYLNGQGPIFHAAVGASALELLRIVWTTDYESRESCWRGFVGCGRAGLLVTLGLGSEYALSQFLESPE